MRHILYPIAIATTLAAAATAAPPIGGNPGLPKNPSLLRSYTVQLYDMPQGTFVAQFSPAKGQLRGVTAKLNGLVRYKMTFNGPPPAGAGWAFTAYAPAYAGNVWFDLQAKGAGNFTSEPAQQIGGQASGEGAATGPNVAKVFAGTGTVRILLSPDLPKFAAANPQIKAVEPLPASIGGTVTYTYLPNLKINKLPK